MDAFIGEIRAFGFNFCPEGWLRCDGSKVLKQKYQALFAIIGPYYGPSDNLNFSLPNLAGITPFGPDPNIPIPVGKTGGVESIVITLANLGSHNHTMSGDMRTGAEAALGTNTPGPTVFISNSLATTSAGTKPGVYSYSSQFVPSELASNGSLIAPTGQLSPLPHDNMMPYVAMQYCICWNGEFPERDE